MLKKLSLGTLIAVLATGVTVGTVSAEEIQIPHEHENPVQVTIEGGILDFVMSDRTVAFTGEIDQSSDTLQVTSEDPTLDLSIVDNRGVEDSFTVQYSLDEFVNSEGGGSLTPTSAFDDVTVGTYDPTVQEDRSIEEIIDLSGLEFEGGSGGFVEAGIYNSVLRTNIVAAP